MPDGLGTALGAAEYVGSIIKVSFEIYCRNGMDGQPYRNVFVFAPRTIYNLMFDDHEYRIYIRGGHALNPDVAGNTLEIQQKKRVRAPKWLPITFLMKLDGKPLATAGGTSYIVAFGGTGETVQATPGSESFNSDGSRADLHFGDPSNRDDFPASNRWISSSVRNLDVTLIQSEQLRARLHKRRGTFAGQ